MQENSEAEIKLKALPFGKALLEGWFEVRQFPSQGYVMVIEFPKDL
jgi:hypothetical protein